MKGFIRQQEERMAMRLLNWQYQRMKIKPPPKQSSIAGPQNWSMMRIASLAKEVAMS